MGIGGARDKDNKGKLGGGSININLEKKERETQEEW